VPPSDPPTFEEFTAAELPRLLGLARALTRNSHDAGDLVNDALAKASLRWRSIERGSNPGDAYWPRASVTLRPGWTEKLQLSATGYRRGDPKPWDEGRLTADGEPIRVFGRGEPPVDRG
jgi:hypothetical protein